jgi:chromate transporter
MLWKMFRTFFKVGAFTFGGGYAMLPLIQEEVVDKNKWLDDDEFLDIIAIAEVTPGPVAVNTSVYVGYKMEGFKGALVCTLGTILPSFLIILCIAMFFSQYRDNEIINKIFMGIRPAVAALIFSAVYKLAKGTKQTVAKVIISVAAALVIILLDISPIYVILAASLGSILYFKGKERKQ